MAWLKNDIPVECLGLHQSDHTFRFARHKGLGFFENSPKMADLEAYIFYTPARIHNSIISLNSGFDNGELMDGHRLFNPVRLLGFQHEFVAARLQALRLYQTSAPEYTFLRGGNLGDDQITGKDFFIVIH